MNLVKRACLYLVRKKGKTVTLLAFLLVMATLMLTCLSMLETALIAVVAFPLAYLSSRQVAGAIGTLFGKAAENVVVTPQHFALVAVTGGILLIIAVMVSCIPALRFKPKQILSQME